jgi:hypothetical protein
MQLKFNGVKVPIPCLGRKFCFGIRCYVKSNFKHMLYNLYINGDKWWRTWKPKARRSTFRFYFLKKVAFWNYKALPTWRLKVQKEIEIIKQERNTLWMFLTTWNPDFWIFKTTLILALEAYISAVQGACVAYRATCWKKWKAWSYIRTKETSALTRSTLFDPKEPISWLAAWNMFLLRSQ